MGFQRFLLLAYTFSLRWAAECFFAIYKCAKVVAAPFLKLLKLYLHKQFSFGLNQSCRYFDWSKNVANFKVFCCFFNYKYLVCTIVQFLPKFLIKSTIFKYLTYATRTTLVNRVCYKFAKACILHIQNRLNSCSHFDSSMEKNNFFFVISHLKCWGVMKKKRQSILCSIHIME